MERERTCEPAGYPEVVHDFVHVDHAPNAESTQSTRHGTELHERWSDSVAHATPPNAAGVVIARILDCWPLPQLRLQVDHSFHSESTQSIAQANSLHGTVCMSSDGHGVPSIEGEPWITRMRECCPPPQGAVHVPHGFQLVTSQSTGQGCALQLPASLSAGHAVPPKSGAVTISRLLVHMPSPHDNEQADHSCHGDTSQCTMQPRLLHATPSSSGGQDVPFAPAACEIVLMRVWLPPPHRALQMSHEPHSDTTQGLLLRGGSQMCALQTCISINGPHAIPP